MLRAWLEVLLAEDCPPSLKPPTSIEGMHMHASVEQRRALTVSG